MYVCLCVCVVMRVDVLRCVGTSLHVSYMVVCVYVVLFVESCGCVYMRGFDCMVECVFVCGCIWVCVCAIACIYVGLIVWLDV